MATDAEYEDFLAGKVQDARDAIQRGESLDNVDVEAEFVRRRRDALSDQAGPGR